MTKTKTPKHYLVKVGERADTNIIVTADSYRVESGRLMFRNDAEYEPFRMFAFGYWRDIERISKEDIKLYTDGD